jgi:hypothetical protein
MKAVVIDTNVAVMANSQEKLADLECVSACLKVLRAVHSQGLVVLDDRQRILTEYRKHLSMSGQPGPGDLFMKWVWTNQANPRFCEQVNITPRSGDTEDFEEFPEDPDLANFDRADRKWVAVARTSKNNPSILWSVERGWCKHRECLARHGVHVECICPHLEQKLNGKRRKGNGSK